MIPFKELHETLKPGDTVTVKGIDGFYKAVFNKWVHCKWKSKNDSYEECRICNGYMSIMENDSLCRHICTGNGSEYSNVSAIIKNKNHIPLLKDSLFKI